MHDVTGVASRWQLDFKNIFWSIQLKLRISELWWPHRLLRIVRGAITFLRNAEDILIESTVHVFIVKNRHGIYRSASISAAVR